MNFLEQLVAEWYKYKGYFVRTNIKFGRRLAGGYTGEMDVVGYNPETQDFVHIETSTDSLSWDKRKEIFQRKFIDARKYYVSVFPMINQWGMKPREIVIVGFNMDGKEKFMTFSGQSNSFPNIKTEIIHIPKLIVEINTILANKNPQNDAIPETYPLLRAIQYSVFYNKKTT